MLFLLRMEEKPLLERRPDVMAETGAELTPLDRIETSAFKPLRCSEL